MVNYEVAMISGGFRYFRKDSLYGLACFENMPVDSRCERGARMKSVGILATSYTLLYRHMQFLETQVRCVSKRIVISSSLVFM